MNCCREYIYPPTRFPIFAAYTTTLQEALESSIKLKETGIKMIILHESFCQLLQPVMHEKIYLYDSLSIGSLYQASKETYVIYLKNYNSDEIGLSIWGKSYKIDGANNVGGMGAAMIILRKGQLFPNTGLVKQFKLTSKKPKSNTFNYLVSNIIIRF